MTNDTKPKCTECGSSAFMLPCLVHDGLRCSRCRLCSTDEETPCPKSSDGIHCDDWYEEDGPCHFCGDDPGCRFYGNAMARKYQQACGLLGISPTKVKLRRLYGKGYGEADPEARTIKVRERTGIITYIHEFLHLLYPDKPHEWIFGACYVLAGKPKRAMRQSVLAAQEISETQEELAEFAKQQAERRGLA